MPQDLGTNLGIDVGKPELATEAYTEMSEAGEDICVDAELDDRGTVHLQCHRDIADFLAPFFLFLKWVLQSMMVSIVDLCCCSMCVKGAVV